MNLRRPDMLLEKARASDEEVAVEQALLETYRSSRKKMLEQGERGVFRAGQILFYEHHTPAGIYLLEKGRGLLRRFTSSHHVCEEEIKTGPCFLGLKNFMEQEPYDGTLLLVQDSAVCFFGRDAALRMVRSAQPPAGK